MSSESPKIKIPVNLVAKKMHVTRAAIYTAIKKRNLKAEKKGKNWLLDEKDVEEYLLNKYNPEKKKLDGKPVFDVFEGYYSVQQAAKYISTHLNRSFSFQRIYYLIRTGDLTAYRHGVSWVIKHEDAEALVYKEKSWMEEKYLRKNA